MSNYQSSYRNARPPALSPFLRAHAIGRVCLISACKNLSLDMYDINMCVLLLLSAYNFEIHLQMSFHYFYNII